MSSFRCGMAFFVVVVVGCGGDFPCDDGQLLAADGSCVSVGGEDGGAATDGGSDGGSDGGGDGGSDPDDRDGDGWTIEGGDCDDADPEVHPGATERCNGIDDDCDAVIPEAELRDADADGDPACVDCDDLDAGILDSDGSCDAYRFPLGMMGVEDSADLEGLAARGINQVHAYNFGPWPTSVLEDDIAWSLAYLDEAEAQGLSVMANLNGRTRAERKSSLDDFSTFADAVAEHAALASWYLADEPEASIDQSALYDMEAALEAANPDLPIQVAHCWCTNWWSFESVGDVSMPDFYGIYADDVPSENAIYHPIFSSYLRTFYTELQTEPIMQGFSYAVYSDQDPETYPVDSRFPTAEELRFWAFADLTLGVKGLWWWSWYRVNEHGSGADWLASTYWPALAEVVSFTDAVKPAASPVVVNPGPYDIVDYTYLAYWPRPSGTFVVAANGSVETRTLDIALGAEFSGFTLNAWDDGEALALDEAGAATVTAKPYEVFVWVLTGG